MRVHLLRLCVEADGRRDPHGPGRARGQMSRASSSSSAKDIDGFQARDGSHLTRPAARAGEATHPGVDREKH